MVENEHAAPPAPVAGRHRSGAPSYRPAEDRRVLALASSFGPRLRSTTTLWRDPQLRSPREIYFHRLSPTSAPVTTALNRPPNRVNPSRGRGSRPVRVPRRWCSGSQHHAPPVAQRGVRGASSLEELAQAVVVSRKRVHLAQFTGSRTWRRSSPRSSELGPSLPSGCARRLLPSFSQVFSLPSRWKRVRLLRPLERLCGAQAAGAALERRPGRLRRSMV